MKRQTRRQILMIFQAIDDKQECVGIYCGGQLHYTNFPSPLTATWRHTDSLKDDNIQYAYLLCGGKKLDEVCPTPLQERLRKSQRRL